jgi:hypothetical protein
MATWRVKDQGDHDCVQIGEVKIDGVGVIECNSILVTNRGNIICFGGGMEGKVRIGFGGSTKRLLDGEG